MSAEPRKVEIDLPEWSEAQEWMFFGSAEYRYRLFPKGRRLGFTRGGGIAAVEYMAAGLSVLWVDTIANNIDRYVRRYFIPAFKAAGVPCRYRQQAKELTSCGGHIDFRSADRPENIEGFGYDVIIINEAGIVLNDRYLWNNAILPMMIDNPKSTLIAGGTPKLRQGKGRLFQELCARAEAGKRGYHMRRFSTYDNPFLTPSAIEEAEEDIAQSEVPQEIHGRFLQPGGTLIKREWIRTSEAPQIVQIGMGVDLAISQKQLVPPNKGTKQREPDFTAIVVVARSKDGRIWILDAQRRRLPFDKILEFIQEMARNWNPQAIKIEDNQFQAAVVQEMLRLTSLPVSGYRAEKDKVTRSGRLVRRYEAGYVHHAPGVPDEYTDELLAFGLDEGHDDQVDAAVLAHMAVSEIGPVDFRTMPTDQQRAANSDEIRTTRLGGDTAGY